MVRAKELQCGKVGMDNFVPLLRSFSGRYDLTRWMVRMKLNELVRRILRFRDARDWGQFHTPKNLATALSIEVSEIQELLLWKTDTQVLEFVRSTKGKGRLEEEL